MGEHEHAWWRNAVIYQLYVRSFADGDGDGTGDLAGVRRHLPTSPNWAWTPSGSTPGTPRRWSTAATTSPTTGPSTRLRHPGRGREADRRGPGRWASAPSSTSSPTTSPTSTPGSGPRSRPAPAAPSGSSSTSGPAAARTAKSRPTTGRPSSAARRGPVDPDGTRRVVPAPVHPASSPTSTGPTRPSAGNTRTSCASGSSAAWRAYASTRPPCSPRTPPARLRRGPRPATPTSTATNSTTSTAPGARIADEYGRRLRRRGLAAGRRALRPLPAPRRAAHRLQLRLPGLPLGRRTAARAPSTTRSPSTPRSAPPPPGCCATTTSPAPSPATAARTPASTSPPRPSAPPTDLALGTRRARAAALLPLALPGAVYVYQGEELGLPEADIPRDRIQDPMHFRSGGTDPGRDGCRVPLPWAGARPAVRLQSRGRVAPSRGCRSPTTGPGSTAEAQQGRPGLHAHALPPGHRPPRPPPHAARPRRHVVSPIPAVLAFERGDVGCLVNLSTKPIALPWSGAVLLASADLSPAPCRPTRRRGSGCAPVPIRTPHHRPAPTGLPAMTSRPRRRSNNFL